MNDIFVLPLSNSDRVCIIDADLATTIMSFNRPWHDSIGSISYRVLLRDFILSKTIFNFFQDESYLGELDHINRNYLDNRLSNLRKATRSQNCCNKGKIKGNYSSKYKGVSWRADRNKWNSEIYINYIRVKGGCFKTEEEAALRYNELAKIYHGEFAVLNVIC